jgi:hypothetical protein
MYWLIRSEKSEEVEIVLGNEKDNNQQSSKITAIDLFSPMNRIQNQWPELDLSAPRLAGSQSFFYTTPTLIHLRNLQFWSHLQFRATFKFENRASSRHILFDSPSILVFAPDVTLCHECERRSRNSRRKRDLRFGFDSFE